jgi:hypothetical protein
MADYRSRHNDFNQRLGVPVDESKLGAGFEDDISRFKTQEWGLVVVTETSIDLAFVVLVSVSLPVL